MRPVMDSYTFFSLSLRASKNYGYFHFVSYGIFAHWFSLNQMLKSSVSFATEVEKLKSLFAENHGHPEKNVDCKLHFLPCIDILNAFTISENICLTKHADSITV